MMVVVIVVVLPDLFRGMGAQRNSAERQQSDYASTSGPEIKNESSAKMARRRESDAGQSRR